MDIEKYRSNMGYVTDAAINNAEAIFNGDSPNVTSLIDLISLVQSLVLNESVIVSHLALKRSSLLQQLDFVGDLNVEILPSESGDTRWDMKLPKGIDGEDVIIDVDDNGNLVSDSIIGELMLATAWSEGLLEDQILGSLFAPENLSEGVHRGDAYFTKFSAFVVWLQALRDIIEFEDDNARQLFLETANLHLGRYRLLANQLLSCRDRFGLDLTWSMIEQPLMSLSLANAVTEPLGYLERFDKEVHNAITGMRRKAFETWPIPAVGAAVLAKAKNLDDLPEQINIARNKLQKARENIRKLNIQLVEFEHEMEFGNDAHFKELNKLQVQLEKALKAFGSETKYQPELEAFPVSTRIWNIPKILKSALDVMKSPVDALDAMNSMPWLRRQSYLRYVPGLASASYYLKSTRGPVLDTLVTNVLKQQWDTVSSQKEILSAALDLTERCAEFRSKDEIENRDLLYIKEDGGETTWIKEDKFWWMMLVHEDLRKLFLPSKE